VGSPDVASVILVASLDLVEDQQHRGHEPTDGYHTSLSRQKTPLKIEEPLKYDGPICGRLNHADRKPVGRSLGA
jgi:hypothetical protein